MTYRIDCSDACWKFEFHAAMVHVVEAASRFNHASPQLVVDWVDIANHWLQKCAACEPSEMDDSGDWRPRKPMCREAANLHVNPFDCRDGNFEEYTAALESVVKAELDSKN